MKTSIAIVAGTVGLGIGIYYLIQGVLRSENKSGSFTNTGKKTNQSGEKHIRGVMHKVKVQNV